MKRSGRVFAAVALVSVVYLFVAAIINRPPDPAFEGKFASEWCQDLLSPHYSVRADAQTAIEALGDRAVPQLRNLLQRRNGPWEKPLVRLSGVIPFFEYRTVDATASRIAASEMLGSLGTNAEPAIPDLVAALAFETSAAESERALVRIGESITPFLQRAVSWRDSLIRVRAARLLREVPSKSEASAYALIEATYDRVSSVRKESALSLGAKFTGSRNETLRRAVSNALIMLSRDEASEVRAAAMQGLGRFRERSSEVESALNAGLRDKDAAVSLEAAKSLWALHEPAGNILGVLISVLESPERWRAAYALGEMGTNAAPAAPALSRLLAMERVPRPFRTPPSAAFALGKIGPSAIPEIARLLEDPDPSVRMNALMAFSFMGKSGRSAIPNLIRVLSDENTEVRHTAALTLASVGAERDQIVAALSDCLTAEDIYMRSAAAAHLREIAPEQTWLIPGE